MISEDHFNLWDKVECVDLFSFPDTVAYTGNDYGHAVCSGWGFNLENKASYDSRFCYAIT